MLHFCDFGAIDPPPPHPQVRDFLPAYPLAQDRFHLNCMDSEDLSDLQNVRDDDSKEVLRVMHMNITHTFLMVLSGTLIKITCKPLTLS
jgi:hypothetical protein